MPCSLVFILLPLVLFAAPQSKVMSKAKILLLPFSVSVGVPMNWRVDNAKVEKLLTTSRASRLNASDLIPDQSGHMLIIASPLSGQGEASAEITVKSTRVSQKTVEAMTADAMIATEWQFRQEIKDAANANGFEITEWHNMTKEKIGNAIALVMHYKYRMAGRKPLNMDSYGIYLGSESIQLRLQYTDENAPALKAELNQVKDGFHIEKINQ